MINDDRIEFTDYFDGEEYYTVKGGAASTTNQRMEIMAALMGVESTPHEAVVIVYSDSRYVVDSFAKRWVYNWERNDWYNSYKEEPRKNSDLWIRFLKAVRDRSVTFEWVKGHSGIELNELADQIAGERMMFYKEIAREQVVVY